MSDWIQAADGKETIREDSDAVIRRMGAEIERLRAALSEIADGDAYYDGAAKFMAKARAALEQQALLVHVGSDDSVHEGPRAECQYCRS